MITIITGNPGAGKSLYTVDKLLRDLVGTTVDEEVDGEIVKHPRTIYTNINGLLLDHEKIDGSATGGLRNWHEWAKPGSVIVVDEVQKIWEPRANGSKVPPDIQALETHRHMGVDFIIITQGLMLTERNLCMLCNRHLHVRRIGNLPLAIVYEWDHASRSLMYSKAISKAPYRYNKGVYKLYKSAKLHTSQKRRIPSLIYFVLAGLIGLMYLAPNTYARLTERTGMAAAKPDQAKAPAVAAKPPESMWTAEPPAPPPAVPASLPAAPMPAAVASAPVFSGCIAAATRCTCYDTQGGKVEREPEACLTITKPASVLLAGGTIPDDPVRHQPEPARFVPSPVQGGGIGDLRRAALAVASSR